MKSQAAMEYLMTYGWAILVIAVVLAALYSLGIFNPNTFAPKASAGSCEIVRPFGPGTTTDIHLEGTCTNMLPKYVASFNGKSSYAIIPNITELESNSFTWSIWIYPTSWNPNNGGLLGQSNSGNKAYIIEQGTTTNPKIQFSNDGGGGSSTYVNVLYSKWQNIVGTYNYTSGIMDLYLDGVLVDTVKNNPESRISGATYIGYFPNSGNYFNGSMANVQIYNKALSANQITALYQEGIGGDPIELTPLVTWYPLNGNADDYSGNKNNGKEYNVGYSSTWYRTYSAP